MLDANMLFYLFSTLLVVCAFMVVIAEHPVFSLLFLVGSFLFSAFLLLLMECEFLSFLFIIVYVGAIAVLFLFAIMMLETKINNLTKNLMKYLPVGFFFGVFLLFSLLNEISTNFEGNAYAGSLYLNKYQNWYDLVDSVTDIESYGQILYSYFVLQFLISGLILLLVLVGVVYLTNNYVSKQYTDQSIFKQVSRNSKSFFDNIN